jgi:hypothetical protein
MLKKLSAAFGAPKTGTAKINGVASQFEGMITELEDGAQMNNDKISNNEAEVAVLQTENQSLDVVNTKARNIRDALNAIVNGG